LSDLVVTSVSPASLAPGAYRTTQSQQTLLPANTPQGNVYLGVYLDNDLLIPELIETNNSMTIPITILPAPLVPPDTSWVYFSDFQDGPDGWVPKDFAEVESFWSRTNYFDQQWGITRGVMWCGTNNNLRPRPATAMGGSIH
jgi:hypothetical protein